MKRREFIALLGIVAGWSFAAQANASIIRFIAGCFRFFTLIQCRRCRAARAVTDLFKMIFQESGN